MIRLLVGWLWQASSNFITLTDPAANGYTVAEGVNSAGQVVGTQIDASGAQNGFLLSGGTYFDGNVPGSTSTVITGINAAGRSLCRIPSARTAPP